MYKFLLLASVLLITNSNASEFHLRRQPLLYQHQYYVKGNVGDGGIFGFIIGPILFILSFVCIWNNERKAAVDYRRVSLAKKLVQQVDPWNNQQIRSSSGQLVHISGKTQCSGQITDPETGVTVYQAIKLKRSVQVRQYRSQTNNNNSQGYQNTTYDLRWVTSNQQNVGGGYSNSKAYWFIKNGVTHSDRVTLGNYILSHSLIQDLQCQQNYTPTMQDAYNIGNRYRGAVRNEPFVSGQYIYFPTQPGSPDAPGTLRIKYEICRPGQTSIISQSSGNTFVPFRIDIHENGKPDKDQEIGTGCCCCLMSECTAKLFQPLRQIDFIVQNIQSTQEMITRKKKQIQCKRTCIRITCYIIMVLSICAFFSPITSLLGYVPLLGGLLANAVGFAIFLSALIVCIPLFILAVAISWLVFHPKIGLLLLGIGLVIAGIVLYFVFRNKGQDNQANFNTMGHFLNLRSFAQQ